MSPVISQLWNKYEPEPNAGTACGDTAQLRANTQCFRANLSYPLATNFGVVRIDHDFGPKWRFFASYRYFGNKPDHRPGRHRRPGQRRHERSCRHRSPASRWSRATMWAA